MKLRAAVSPMNGSVKLRDTIWPMASTIVVSRTRNPQKMKACMIPLGNRCRSLRWARTSAPSTPTRLGRSSTRFTGWPSRTI